MQMKQSTTLACNFPTKPDQVREKENGLARRPWNFWENVATTFQHLPNPEYSRSWFYFAYTLYLFPRDNLIDIVVLGYSFGVICALCGPIFGFDTSLGLLEILCRSPAMLFWSWTNLLLFTVSNQRHLESIKEDAINKPSRPLPAKRLTAAEATSLMYAMYPIVILFSVCSGGLGPCLLLMFITLWYNECRGAETPFIKNFLNGGGFACFLAGPLEVLVIGRGSSILRYSRAVQWLALIAFAIFTTSHTQDFRDLEGDKLRNRRTVPLVIGDTPARWLVVIIVLLYSCIAPMFWHMGVAGFLLPASTGSVMVFNLLGRRTVEGDILTWKLWSMWIASFFLLPLVKMRSDTVMV